MQTAVQTPWWMRDGYAREDAVPDELRGHAGPNGLALVRTWKNGTTDTGWGLTSKSGPGFMEKYTSGKFRERVILPGYDTQRWNFAFVMRSMRLVCIDIDGKNGGLTHVGRLGMLPWTLAETSKSGDGYHLFYAVSEDEWSDTEGFAMFQDRISLEQGVDLRAVGCVYHYPQQRWNEHPIAELPDHLKNRLKQRQQTTAAQIDAIIKLLDAGDPTEVALMQDAMITDLNKPIPAGRRNTTLFAIGSQMMLAKVPGWSALVHSRAMAVGLDHDEADKLVNNIIKYGSN